MRGKRMQEKEKSASAKKLALKKKYSSKKWWLFTKKGKCVYVCVCVWQNHSDHCDYEHLCRCTPSKRKCSWLSHKHSSSASATAVVWLPKTRSTHRQQQSMFGDGECLQMKNVGTEGITSWQCSANSEREIGDKVNLSDESIRRHSNTALSNQRLESERERGERDGISQSSGWSGATNYMP